MDSLIFRPVQEAAPHALPFRVFLEEHRRRREADLLRVAEEILSPLPTWRPGEETGKQLMRAVSAQETAYLRLDAARTAICKGAKPETSPDDLLKVCYEADRPLKLILHRLNASALCLSGGGIRSASFCLGVMQGLSSFSRSSSTSPTGLMDRIDYLSTVSGGGYIGSWLMSWVFRRKDTGGAATWESAYGQAVTGLAGFSVSTSGDPEPEPIQHLRNYTSFLAPALGFTLDSFTLIAIVLRNLLINWTMLLPILLAVIAAAKWLGKFFLWTKRYAAALFHQGSGWFSPGNFFLAGVCLCFLIASVCAAVDLPSHSKAERFAKLRVGITVVFIGSVLAGSWLLAILPTPAENDSWQAPFLIRSLIAFVGYLTLSSSIWITYRNRAKELGKPVSNWRRTGTAAVMCLLSAAAISMVASGLLFFVQIKLIGGLETAASHTPWLHFLVAEQRSFIILSPPLILLVLLISTSLLCGLLGVYEMEEDREWWVRTGGWFLAFSIAWILTHAAVLYGAQTLRFIYAGISGLALGWVGSLVGYSTATSAGTRPPHEAQVGAVGRFLQRHTLLLPAVAGISLALILLGNVAAEEWLRHRFVHWLMEFSPHLKRRYTSATLLYGAVCALSGVAVNFALNINLFSLHGMYRMRLMRAFLGASNANRRPDPFTKFDPRDTPLERDLPCDPGAPMHLINTTLNLTGTRNTAWRQRKAESFTFSPIYSGGWRVGYVPTENYAGFKGISLATAMSISGAAFNPNMGYQSSPVLSLLMTLFCVRLGMWLPNPKRPAPMLKGFGAENAAFFSKSGPSFALQPLVEEAFGLTDDAYRWIELTDGGHFENLGLYEMVMRRCKNIIVVDAGADPLCQFEDLGNAVRKIHIDLGVPIVFPDTLKMRAGIAATNSYCVVGKIDYGCVDEPPEDQTRDQLAGRIVYIKASLSGREPADILQYAKTHATFPHETTVNQFFNESQFESYRHLGSFAVQSIIKYVVDQSDTDFNPNIDSFMHQAEKFWSDTPDA